MRRERKGISPSEYQTSGQYEPPGSVPIPVRPPGSKPPRHPLFPSMENLQHSTDQQVLAWHRLASHPVLKECYESRDSLIDAMIKRLDELAEKEKKYDKDHGIGAKVQDRFLLSRFLRRN